MAAAPVQKRNVTILDVAREAGVSHATVSRVINHRGGVSPSCAQEVRRAMQALGYTPPPPAHRRGRNPREFVQGQTGNIALLSSGPRNLSSSNVGMSLMQGVSDACGEKGLNLVLCSLNESQLLPALVRSGQVDGVLVQGPEPDSKVCEVIRAFPVVWLLSSGNYTWGDRVGPDNDAIGRLAFELLRSRGHTDLACITNSGASRWTVSAAYSQRAAAFAVAATIHGVKVRELGFAARGLPSDYDRESVEALIRSLKALPKLPTGLFVANDLMPQLQADLAEHGIVAGRDVEIVCCNRENFTPRLRPTPLVLSIEPEAIGRMAVDHLLWRLKNRKAPGPVRTLLAPVVLVEGDSAARWAGREQP